jgi:hypothetical protein
MPHQGEENTHHNVGMVASYIKDSSIFSASLRRLSALCGQKLLTAKYAKKSRQGREAVRALRRPIVSLLVSMSYAQDRSFLKMSSQ